MKGYRLGRVLGIELRVRASWLVIAGLVMWSLSTAALPADFPGIDPAARLAMAAAITLLFFGSLLAHELGHSVVALARGIPVHRITFFLFGGMAETSTESRSPGEEFLIAIAGPVASFLLAGLFFAIWQLGGGAWSPAITGAAIYLAVLNLILGAFNLLPGFPMDGGRVLRAALWKWTGSALKATRWASRVGVLLATLLMGYGLWSALTGDPVGGVWLVLIGLFIRSAARASYRQHVLGRLDEAARAAQRARSDVPPRGDGGPGGLRRDPAYAAPPMTGRDVTDLRPGRP